MELSAPLPPAMRLAEPTSRPRVPPPPTVIVCSSFDIFVVVDANRPPAPPPPPISVPPPPPPATTSVLPLVIALTGVHLYSVLPAVPGELPDVGSRSPGSAVNVTDDSVPQLYVP